MTNVYDTLQTRGFIKQGTDEKAVRDLFEREQVTAYVGYDPTAESLHVGNLLSIMALKHLEIAGHRPLTIVGGGTGMVGDPSGRTELRQMLGADTIGKQTACIRGQLQRYLDFDGKKSLIENNADWLLDLNYIEFLREIGRHFSVNRMLSFEAYKARMEKGLSFLEFNYQLLQAYDFLVLYRMHGCRLQMGGDDQWGNIVAGTDLIRRTESAEAFGLTSPLVTTASGAKMGKTAEGGVWLDAGRVSPYDYYQFWVNCDDRDVKRWLALYTFLPMDEVERLGAFEGEKIRDAKQVLAFEATKITHGEEEAQTARDAALAAFSGGGDMDGVPTRKVARAALEAGIEAIQLFVEAGLVGSRGEAKRLIKAGGAYVNKEKVPAIDHAITADLLDGEGCFMIRAGKKKYVRIQAES